MESRITLPLNFLSRMKDMLGSEEFDAFLKSYEDPPVRGIRMNPLKPANSPYNSQVPWCKNGFYYSPDERPAKTIAYHAGLFYIQEPSAMCPVEILGVEAGDKVLDICAAPGGKSVQIAGHLMGRGLLISNDNSASRNRALVKNLERAGVTNAVVLTEQPKNLAKRFPEFFDKILIDVPCSGEGMFRRDPDVIKSYERTPPETYTALQTEILENAAKMLKPSGQMVYSTCTFNTLENENIIANFVQSHNDFSQIQTTRIFPHLSQGEGHFACLLKKIKSFEGGSGETFLQKSFPRELIDFQNTFLCENAFPNSHVFHEKNLFLQPLPLNLNGLRVARSGWHIGEIDKGRFTPSQALAMGIRKEQARFSVELSKDDANRYLRGESLYFDGEFDNKKPWVLVCCEGHPLGWARLVSKRLKNNLPPSWTAK